MPDAWPHPWPACNKKSRRQSPQVSRINRHSLRNGFRLITGSPRRPGFFATVARGHVHALDPSVGGSGPLAFAVRTGIARPAQPHPEESGSSC